MNQNTRIASLDFFRGFTMLLLISGGALQFFSRPEFSGTILYSFFLQFTHPNYEGFRFWDLIQPFFMFIVGVAIPFSVSKRLSHGQSWSRIIIHAAKRSIILILLGISLYTNGQEFSLTFQDVLAQIGFTYFFTLLLSRFKLPIQLVVSLSLIIVTEILYRLFPMEGTQPFVIGKTFGDYINNIIAPGTQGNWASFNAVPTTAHTIWGAICGQLIQSKPSQEKKIKYLILGGILALVIGYLLTFISPFNKKICTSSFIFASGGWSILAFTLCFWIIDIKKHRKWAKFGIVVGMNPIFIYLLADTIKKFIIRFLGSWVNLFFASWVPAYFNEIFLLLIAWFTNWYICFYLYKKHIFIKI